MTLLSRAAHVKAAAGGVFRKVRIGVRQWAGAWKTSDMPPQRATLLQVAQRAGVSRSTASFVLAGRHVDMRISEDARQRVLRAAQELDYRPNLMARSLRTKVTKTIALVSDTLASDPYAGRAIHGSLAAAVAHGHLLFIGETEGDAVIEEKLISDFLDRQVDAFVYASMFTRYVRVPKQLKGHPVVLLNCMTRAARPAYHAVIPDEVAAGWSAAKVVARGRSPRGHPPGRQPGPPRLRRPGTARRHPRGPRRGAASSWPGRSTATGGRTRRTRRSAAALAGGSPPKVLICLNDRVALGAYQALREAGTGHPGRRLGALLRRLRPGRLAAAAADQHLAAALPARLAGGGDPAGRGGPDRARGAPGADAGPAPGLDRQALIGFRRTRVVSLVP